MTGLLKISVQHFHYLLKSTIYFRIKVYSSSRFCRAISKPSVIYIGYSPTPLEPKCWEEKLSTFLFPFGLAKILSSQWRDEMPRAPTADTESNKSLTICPPDPG